MGHRTQNLQALLECLFELGHVPDEPWAIQTVTRGLCSSDPEIRELAIAAAGTGIAGMWAPVLYNHSACEPEAWLARFATLVVQDLQALTS